MNLGFHGPTVGLNSLQFPLETKSNALDNCATAADVEGGIKVNKPLTILTQLTQLTRDDGLPCLIWEISFARVRQAPLRAGGLVDPCKGTLTGCSFGSAKFRGKR